MGEEMNLKISDLLGRLSSLPSALAPPPHGTRSNGAHHATGYNVAQLRAHRGETQGFSGDIFEEEVPLAPLRTTAHPVTSSSLQTMSRAENGTDADPSAMPLEREFTNPLERELSNPVLKKF